MEAAVAGDFPTYPLGPSTLGGIKAMFPLANKNNAGSLLIYLCRRTGARRLSVAEVGATICFAKRRGGGGICFAEPHALGAGRLRHTPVRAMLYRHPGHSKPATPDAAFNLEDEALAQDRPQASDHY